MFSAVSDALVALGRIGKFLTAEELAEPYAIERGSKDAVKADGDFTWETTKGTGIESKFEVKGKGKGGQGEKKKGEKKKEKKGGKDSILPVTAPGSNENEKSQDKEKESDEKPFQLNGLKVNIPRGSFVAIVGRVGSGKSSFLQALTGEMRRTKEIGRAHV